MARAFERLTALEVANYAKAATGKAKWPKWIPDGGGLYFVVDSRRPDEKTGRGTASWAYRYMMDRKARAIGLGPYPTITLAKARALALDARQKKATGRDPLAVKDAERAARRTAAARAVTFKEVAEEYVRTNRAQWKNAKHAAQWEATLKAYAYPVIGDWIVGEIDIPAVLKVLKQEVRDPGKPPSILWNARNETARRVRQRIEAVLASAKMQGLREGENPAAWENVKPVLPSKRIVKHYPAMLIDDIPGFMPKLRADDCLGARALEFLILTAARTGEVVGGKETKPATWSEIDLERRVWTVPEGRMKKEKEHHIPLSDAAVALLKGVKPADISPNAVIFPGSKPGKSLSNMTMAKRLKALGPYKDAKGDNVTVHGFRSTFRDWGTERTNFPSELFEKSLAHGLKDKTEAAYQRSNLLEQRRPLMDAWASYLAAPVGGNVVELRPAGAA